MRASLKWSALTCLGAFLLLAQSSGAEPKPRSGPGMVLLAPPATTKVHILLIFDTNAAELAPILALDKDKLQRVIKADLDAPKYDLTVLEGPDVTADRILKYYDDLAVAPTESVFCYYAGHGGYDDNGGLFFDLKAKGTGSLVRSQLLDAMKAKSGRLTALITDCCANPSTIRPPPKEMMAEVVVGDLKNPGFWIKALLLRTTGVVDINGCDSRTRQRSFAVVGKDVDKGGLFTDNLVSIWDREVVSFADVKAVTWQSFFDQVREGTQRDFKSLLKNDPDASRDPAVKGQPDQTPEALQLDVQQDDVRALTGWRLGLRVFNNNGDGVRVGQVFDKTAAQKAGFEVGDVLLSIDGKTLASEADFAACIDACTSGHINVVLRDVRTKKTTPPVDVPLDPK